jgi:hypothetical protein|nr:MAG TPA_asm: hypothetical protein [Inoviridae sp.]DAR01329.1 MAG TPA: hypothetical protein [Inoviridae sp.]
MLLSTDKNRKAIECAVDSTLYKDDTKNERFEYLVEEDENFIYYTAIYRMKKNGRWTRKKLEKEKAKQKSPLTDKLQELGRDSRKELREEKGKGCFNTIDKIQLKDK